MDWRPRKAHYRRLQSGRIVLVKETVVPVQRPRKRKPKTSKCPRCGEQVFFVRMPSGGQTYFEGGKGLKRVKHRCFNRGSGLSKKRDPNTPDLFENEDQDTAEK